MPHNIAMYVANKNTIIYMRAHAHAFSGIHARTCTRLHGHVYTATV